MPQHFWEFFISSHSKVKMVIPWILLYRRFYFSCIFLYGGMLDVDFCMCIIASSYLDPKNFTVWTFNVVVVNMYQCPKSSVSKIYIVEVYFLMYNFPCIFAVVQKVRFPKLFCVDLQFYCFQCVCVLLYRLANLGHAFQCFHSYSSFLWRLMRNIISECVHFKFWSSRWNCGDSIISASSGTSHASVRTITSLLRFQRTDSTYVYMPHYIHACDRSMLTWYAAV